MSEMSLRCAQAGCANVICMTVAQVDRLRETHVEFYCPMGHSNFFPQETDEEREIAELRREIASIKRVRDRWRENYEEVRALFDTCPVAECGWRSKAGAPRLWRSMLQHLLKAHGISVAGPLDIPLLSLASRTG